MRMYSPVHITTRVRELLIASERETICCGAIDWGGGGGGCTYKWFGIVMVIVSDQL